MRLERRILCLILLFATLVTNSLCADIPVYYDGSKFQEIAATETTGSISGNFTLAGPADGDYGSFSVGIPRLSEPTGEIKPKVDLIKESVDPESTITHNKAVEFAARSPGPFNIGQICFIYEYLRENWKYVPDPRGIDYFSKGSNTIELAERITTDEMLVAGAGDCDDYSILMASLLESVGGTTRIILATSGDQGHAYSEVYIGRTDDDLTRAIISWLRSYYKCTDIYGHITEENNAFWLNLDWNSTHPGGPLYKSERQSYAYLGEKYDKTKVILPPEYSQSAVTGSLVGSVFDENGYPLACTVIATDVDSNEEYPYSVSNSGNFEFELPPGTYMVTADKPGYSFSTEYRTVIENIRVSTNIVGAVFSWPNIEFKIEPDIDWSKRCGYYTRDSQGHYVFKIKVYVTGSDLHRIKSVKYSLHETFENPEHISTDASNDFKVIIWAWGKFPMPIIVTTKDGNEYEYIITFTFRDAVEAAQRMGIKFIDATAMWDVIGGY